MDVGMMRWVHAACTAEYYTAYDRNAVAPKAAAVLDVRAQAVKP